MARVYRSLTFISTIVLAAASLTGTGSPAAAGPPATGGTDSDLAVTTVGDAQGFHVLVGSGSNGYAWHTAATLAEPGYDTDEWIGQVCVTGSGRRAVAVYAPRQFTNREVEFNGGAFVAVLDLSTGAVRKLPVRASLAYYNPGCGPDERVAVSTLRTDGDPVTSVVSIVDAATAAVTGTSRSAGQLSSAVPFGDGLAAALGSRLVSVERSGAVHTLDSLSAAPFRLHPDAAGGIAFEVPRRNKSGDRVEVRRYAGGRAALLGTGRLDSVRLAGVAGRVFVSGADAGQIKLPSSAGWRNVGGSVDGQPSVTGALVVTNVGNQNAPTAAAAAAGQLHTPGRSDPVHIQATRTADHTRLDWQLTPGGASPAGRDASPALTSPGPHAGGAGAAPGQMRPNVDGSAVPWDPDAACSVPRNDPTTQTFQATGQQVEWATDLAVKGALTVSRPANFRGSGMPAAWSPQGMFPLHTLAGYPTHTVPAQVLLGVLAQESNTMQASPHAVDGITGNFNQGGFYGDWSSWDTADCGYGVGQVTTGMSVAEGNSVYQPDQRKAIATDYASNIAASLNILIDKWNATRAAGIVANDGSPDYVQNWWFALWAYNSGIQPRSAEFGNSTGCTPSPSCTDGDGNWGLGWSNNPANPDYPIDRHVFHTSDQDTMTPNLWPYEELVMGWAATPVARYDYSAQGWRWAYLPENLPYNALAPMPVINTFCTTAANDCVPEGATDIKGQSGAGLCQRWDLHCWWHQSISWIDCTAFCGTEQIQYAPGSAEPAAPQVYPADCSATGLLAGAVIVDDVTTPSVAPCTKTWTNQGTFSFYFPPDSSPDCSANCILYPGKIDFHQIGVGFGGHIWFSHLGDVAEVVGTWTPPSYVAGWQRIEVHIPDNGATTQMADYQINLGNGQTRHRVVNQNWSKNTWVDLGTFNLSTGASVSLSNSNSHVVRTDGGDVAFDAVAFIPSLKPYASYVALGDSYAAGEGLSPYEPDSDQYNDGDPNKCHRSSQAAAYQVKLPGHGSTLAADEAAGTADFHFLACSGAETINLSASAVDPANPWNTDWGIANFYRSNEPYQIDDTGWLDEDTTLVTLSIGGNDARWVDILRGCLVTWANCLAPDFKLTSRGQVDPEPLVTYEPKVIDALRYRLEPLYAAIHQRAPNARVVVVGYPRLFDDNPLDGCQGYTPDQQNWMNQRADQFNQSIQNAVNDIKAAYPTMNITAVDPSAGFRDHRVCDAPNWINGLTGPTSTGSDGGGSTFPGSGSYHPTTAGQTEYASLINGKL